MKKATVLAALALAIGAQAQPFATWGKYREITVNTTATGANVTSAQAQFPLLVRLTNAHDSTGATILSEALAGGADVRLFGPVTGTRDTWALPAGGWKKTKKGFKYADKAHANGPVTNAAIAGGKLVVKAKGPSIAYPLLGTGPQQAIATAAVFHGAATALCADFAAPKKDDPTKGIFVASKAPTPADCRAL